MDKDSLLALITSLEKWALFFGILVAIGVAGESVYGIRLYWNNRKLQRMENAESERRQAEVARLGTELAKAQNETAQAQLALKRIDSKAGQRFLNIKDFMKALKGKPKGVAKIWFKRNDSEAYMFAQQIYRWLGAGYDGDGAAWTVSEPKPIPSDGGDPSFSADVPADIRYGSGSGLTLRAPVVNFDKPDTAKAALSEALMRCRESGGAMVILGDPELPDGHFIIVVEQKQS